MEKDEMLSQLISETSIIKKLDEDSTRKDKFHEFGCKLLKSNINKLNTTARKTIINNNHVDFIS